MVGPSVKGSSTDKRESGFVEQNIKEELPRHTSDLDGNVEPITPMSITGEKRSRCTELLGESMESRCTYSDTNKGKPKLETPQTADADLNRTTLLDDSIKPRWT